ncbi:MAG: hypothetical protein FD127_1880 [Acidimicrobiaceae bacterium]|nr:MAG: hypothetical protein FD127_1880 [Acidimicrobiaceae bacterium]
MTCSMRTPQEGKARCDFELAFESNADDAELIHDAVNDFLLDHLETVPNDVPWTMTTTLGLGKRESRRWKPLLHSSRR